LNKKANLFIFISPIKKIISQIQIDHFLFLSSSTLISEEVELTDLAKR